MSLIGRTERELAAQTLTDFERDGLGHHLDNADADVLRAMVRLSAERQRGAVDDADRLREVLREVLLEPDPIKRNQLAAPVLTNPGGSRR